MNKKELIMDRYEFQKIKDRLIPVGYPHGTTALYDSETDTYYNQFGLQLRDPQEYDTTSEGYTPFGDEEY